MIVTVKFRDPLLLLGGRFQRVWLHFSAVLSSYLLGETLNILGKLGCLLCLLGSVLLVIHAPQEQEVTSLQDMTNKLLEPGENRDLIASVHFSGASNVDMCCYSNSILIHQPLLLTWVRHH